MVMGSVVFRSGHLFLRIYSDVHPHNPSIIYPTLWVKFSFIRLIDYPLQNKFYNYRL